MARKRRAKLSQTLLWGLEWAAFAGLTGGFGLLPAAIASHVGAVILSLLGPLLPAHRIAAVNLALAFPEMAPQARNRLRRAMWRQLGRVFGEFAHVKRFRIDGPTANIRIHGREHLDALKAGKTGAVFVSGHFANWEAMACALTQTGIEAYVTYRASNNPFVDRRIIATRKAYGVNILTPKGEGARQLHAALARGASVTLLGDQKNNDGIEVPFFGAPAMTATGAARLALRYDVPIIRAFLVRTGPMAFDLTIDAPYRVDRNIPEAEAVRQTILDLNAFFERAIRAYPAQWFWVHRRWPNGVYGGGRDDLRRRNRAMSP